MNGALTPVKPGAFSEQVSLLTHMIRKKSPIPSLKKVLTEYSEEAAGTPAQNIQGLPIGGLFYQLQKEVIWV